MNYIRAGFDRVGVASNNNEILKNHDDTINIGKNGYLYVYASNESDVPVFFDNLQLTHTRGPLLEETHYYPFGLTMAGISSKAAGMTENKKKYQQYEFNSDFDINLYESFYRSHDPQLGRFWQVDPKPESAEMLSTYSAMSNNPISNTDPLGDIVRNAHDEEVNLATERRDAAAANLNTSMGNYGVADRNISKKSFRAGGRTKAEWKDFKSTRKAADRAESRLNTALSNQFEAQEDINELRHNNPTLFNAANNLAIDVFIGRTNDKTVRVDAGGGANLWAMRGDQVIGSMINLKEFFGNGRDAVFRNGMAIWVQNGRGQASTTRHEIGHVVSMYGGVPGIGIGGIPYGTLNNPASVRDYFDNYARLWGAGCEDCRTGAAACNPTSAAAVAAENLPREAAAAYIRQVNPFR